MPSIQWQPTLFAADPPRVDPTFTAVVRHQLDSRTWVDHGSGWLEGSEAVLDDLLGRSWVPPADHAPGHLTAVDRTTSGIEAIGAALSARYEIGFDRIEATRFRNGHDLLDWTRHPAGEEFTNPVVATVALGSRRSIKLRSRTALGGATTFVLNPGDLFVTGGAAHDTWEHALSRAARVRDPFVMLTFTHSHGRVQPRS